MSTAVVPLTLPVRGYHGMMFSCACSDVGYEKMALDGPCIPTNGPPPTPKNCTEGGIYQVPSGYVLTDCHIHRQLSEVSMSVCSNECL